MIIKFDALAQVNRNSYINSVNLETLQQDQATQ